MGLKSVNADSADAPPIAADESLRVGGETDMAESPATAPSLARSTHRFIGGYRRGIGGIGVLPFLSP
jgi:hypothetical protein